MLREKIKRLAEAGTDSWEHALIRPHHQRNYVSDRL